MRYYLFMADFERVVNMSVVGRGRNKRIAKKNAKRLWAWLDSTVKLRDSFTSQRLRRVRARQGKGH